MPPWRINSVEIDFIKSYIFGVILLLVVPTLIVFGLCTLGLIELSL